MYLSRLDIQGFKSFATPVTLHFKPGITAVVGPNGSGKSNVAEAIRWALGEQSTKALRAKRSDDVIFAGSDRKARLGVAEVSLTLDNADGRAATPYSELVITRRIYRDGEGEYLINHQPARLQDIQLLLAQANFGQRTYSVIGQGMIDSFLLSSPQERKHLFDEAAGVRQYQLKREQALNKLAQARENLIQGEAVMAEIEPRLRSLTRQVRRLERREEVERELRGKQEVYYGLLWAAVERERGTLQGEFDQAESRRADIAAELQGIQSELEKIERERTANEVFSDLQRQYNQVLDQKNKLVQEQSVLKGQLEVAVKEAGRGEVVYHQQRLEETQRALAALAEELEVAEQQVQRHAATLERETGERNKLDAQLAEIENRMEAQTKAINRGYSLPKARQALEEYYAQFKSYIRSLDALSDPSEIRTRASTLERDLRAIIDRLADSGEADPGALIELQRQLLSVSKDRQGLVDRVTSASLELGRAEDARQRLTEERTVRQAELKKLQQESSILELAKTNPEQAYAAYADQLKHVEADIVGADEQLRAAREAMNNFNALETAKKDRLFSLQKAFRDSQQHLNHAASRANDVRVELAKVDQRRDDLEREIGQAMSLDAVDHIKEVASKKPVGDQAVLAEEIGHLNKQLQLIGGIDEQVTQEYRETNERWEFLNGQAEDLRQAIDSLDRAIAELDVTIKQRFDAAFKKINAAFHQYFRTLFSGGKAELVLVQEEIQSAASNADEEEDETESEAPKKTVAAGEKVITGIDIKATPPGKKLQSIAMLSGGERALTSIALLCAIISNNPSPFVVLDEVDAALDEANSQRFAAILDHLATSTQFITITHNRATMEKSQVMYGVTMGEDGVSQLLSVKIEEAEEIIRQHGNR